MSEFMQLFSDDGLSARAFLLMQLSRMTVNADTAAILGKTEVESHDSFEAMLADLNDGE